MRRRAPPDCSPSRREQEVTAVDLTRRDPGQQDAALAVGNHSVAAAPLHIEVAEAEPELGEQDGVYPVAKVLDRVVAAVVAEDEDVTTGAAAPRVAAAPTLERVGARSPAQLVCPGGSEDLVAAGEAE
jgi:hypothetical protein